MYNYAAWISASVVKIEYKADLSTVERNFSQVDLSLSILEIFASAFK